MTLYSKQKEQELMILRKKLADFEGQVCPVSPSHFSLIWNLNPVNPHMLALSSTTDVYRWLLLSEQKEQEQKKLADMEAQVCAVFAGPSV